MLFPTHEPGRAELLLGPAARWRRPTYIPVQRRNARIHLGNSLFGERVKLPRSRERERVAAGWVRDVGIERNPVLRVVVTHSFGAWERRETVGKIVTDCDHLVKSQRGCIIQPGVDRPIGRARSGYPIPRCFISSSCEITSPRTMWPRCGCFNSSPPVCGSAT